MAQPENIMAIFLSANGLALLAMAVVLGRYLQRVEQCERRIQAVEAGRTDVALATLSSEMKHLGAGVSEMREQVRRISEFLMVRPPGLHAEGG